jgi:Flp pilus assembly protein TadG
MKVRNSKKRGSVIVEMAVVLPIMLLLIIGGLDLTLMAQSKSNLNYITGETARCMAQSCAGSAQAYAQQEATGLGLHGNLTVTVTYSPPCPQPIGNPPCTATVTAANSWKPISPFFRPTTLTSVATGVQ